MQHKDILFGLLGGVTTALLLLASGQSGLLSMFLIVLVPFPVYVTTLGWGLRAAVASVAVSFAILAFGASLNEAITFTILFAGIAAITGFQTNLAQADPQNPDQLIWYPLSLVLFNLVILVCIAVIVGAYLNNINVPSLEKMHLEGLVQLSSIHTGLSSLSEDDLQKMAKFYARMMPFVMPTILILFHAFSLSLAVSVTRRSQLLFRPAESLAATLTQPVIAIVLLGVSMLIMSFSTGVLGQAASVLAGGLTTAFALVGLASFHFRMRGKPAGPMLIFVAYAAIVVFLMPFFLFAIGGLIRVFSNIQNPTLPNNPNQENS